MCFKHIIFLYVTDSCYSCILCIATSGWLYHVKLVPLLYRLCMLNTKFNIFLTMFSQRGSGFEATSTDTVVSLAKIHTTSSASDVTFSLLSAPQQMICFPYKVIFVFTRQNFWLPAKFCKYFNCSAPPTHKVGVSGEWLALSLLDVLISLR